MLLRSHLPHSIHLQHKHSYLAPFRLPRSRHPLPVSPLSLHSSSRCYFLLLTLPYLLPIILLSIPIHTLLYLSLPPCPTPLFSHVYDTASSHVLYPHSSSSSSSYTLLPPPYPSTHTAYKINREFDPKCAHTRIKREKE